MNRKSKSYPEKFYKDIMDESYKPINKIWIDEGLYKTGCYSKILYGEKNNVDTFKRLVNMYKFKKH
tara:strand:- start:1549 stop:1746 length:198 start_codon:yes stop_codon:yes gene_type:complete